MSCDVLRFQEKASFPKGNEVFFGILFPKFLKWHMQSGWLDCMKLMLIHEFHGMKKKSMNFYNRLVDWWDKDEQSMNLNWVGNEHDFLWNENDFLWIETFCDT